MDKPAPAQGLVIRYDYLWRDEANRGRAEGAKDRPCAIVLAITRNGATTRVLLAPITHTPPDNPGDAIEIPPRVKAALGLDRDRSWIITREFNSVAWSDPGITPATATGWAYGMLPARLVKAVVDSVLAHQQRGPAIVKRAE